VTQPPPDTPSDFEPPQGFHLEWAESEGWRLASRSEQEVRFCRRPGCMRRPVAALLRGSRRPSWWLYCDWHLYGRRIVDGRIEHRRAVRDAA
jgi:hypothetical protein